ncbi:MAG: DUF4982 domain-containing protein [Bacteroidales bacterium]|nr:DUF4982 domain-containing protein [Bacteroidales bacterium]
MRKGTIRFKVFCVLLLIPGFVINAHSQRTVYNFNYGWKLHVGEAGSAASNSFSDAGWQGVSLPFAWNQQEAFRKDIRDLPTGIAWYRKTFQLPENSSVEKVFIEFEGVRQMAEVFINGVFIGRHENGVMAFGFDLTHFVKPWPEENVIAVRTDNSWDYREKLTGAGFQWNDKNFNANYGGIPKNVFLHITSHVYQTLPLYSTLGTTGTYIYATDIDVPAEQACIHAETQVRNETTAPVDIQLRVHIEDMDGQTVASFPGDLLTLPPGGMTELHASDTLQPVHFWSTGYGYLYNVFTDLVIDGVVVDRVKTRTGFRKTRFGEGLIRLNDRVIMMKGYAQRTSNEWPAVGMSVPAWLSDYSNRLIIEGSGNMVRWMHVTPWKQDVESCDRVGLIQAMPAGDSEGDVHDRRWEHRKALMRDAIIYNRNNPSILFYECGNENISEEHMAEMVAIRDKYDPHGGRAIGSREMLGSDVAEYGGEMLYINKSAGIPFWAMEYSRDEGLRKYWDDFTPPYHRDGAGPPYRGGDASDYNRNQDSHAIENVIRWFDYWEMRPGTGRRVSSGGANIIFSDTNTHHRGEENYRRSGEVDAMRIPKENYWAHKIIWDGWVDPDSIGVHLLGHWNYGKGVVKDVTAISTADRVELFLNGKSLGMGEQDNRFLFTFKDVAFIPGTISAVGYDREGVRVCETHKSTAGKPSALKLSILQRPGGMIADGHDLAIIQVEVVDKNGHRCPVAMNMIQFEVEGAGEFVGGIAQGPDNYIGATSLPVECGINRIFIRSGKEAGVINIKAASKGLKQAAVRIETRETDSADLSGVLPGDGLPSYLKKGPTPRTPSYRVSRIPVEIVSAKAAINSETAHFSFDDNEMTEWRNDGRLETGIIEFKLERTARINQAVFKLAGWRNRSYPLSIFVDDREVYRDTTPRSLGYVTCTFPPAEGKRVRVQLTGATGEKEGFNIVELSGTVDMPGEGQGRGRGGSQYLGILEAEFYEPVR